MKYICEKAKTCPNEWCIHFIAHQEMGSCFGSSCSDETIPCIEYIEIDMNHEFIEEKEMEL